MGILLGLAGLASQADAQARHAVFRLILAAACVDCLPANERCSVDQHFPVWHSSSPMRPCANPRLTKGTWQRLVVLDTSNGGADGIRNMRRYSCLVTY